MIGHPDPVVVSNAGVTRRLPRTLAVGGIVGPVGMVGAWAVLGAVKDGYSPVEDAISRLAAVHAGTRLPMTAGFLAFGVGVPLYAAVLHDELPGRAWVTALATSIATLGVAATPLDVSPTVDLLHGGLATAGYVTLAATPWLAAPALTARGHRRAALASRVVAGLSGASLVATTVGPAHGLFQRLGLAVVDAWIVATAVWLLRSRRD